MSKEPLVWMVCFGNTSLMSNASQSDSWLRAVILVKNLNNLKALLDQMQISVLQATILFLLPRLSKARDRGCARSSRLYRCQSSHWPRCSIDCKNSIMCDQLWCRNSSLIKPLSFSCRMQLTQKGKSLPLDRYSFSQRRKCTCLAGCTSVMITENLHLSLESLRTSSLIHLQSDQGTA